jgi:hypothetical protein
MIFSLPRSGSAWLSVLLTYTGTFCYHEPLSERESLDELFKRPGSGGVDTIAYTRPELRFKYRSFVLKRDIDQIEKSSRQCGVSYKAPVKQFEAATKALPVIDYHKLDQINYLESVWHMIAGTPFDRARGLQLIGMNIQRDLEKYRLKAPHLAYFPDQSKSLRGSRYTG